MIAQFAPALWMAVLAIPSAVCGKDPANAGVQLEAKADRLAALAESNRERWQNSKGDWEFKPDSLTGSGDCRIDFRGPFAAPFTVDFRINVLKGMRPRVFLGPLTFANEKYEQTFALYPEQKDAVPFPYKNETDYAVSIGVEREGATLTVDGSKVMTAGLSFETVDAIGFSGGDRWSKGTTRFSDIVVRTRAETPEVPAGAASADTTTAKTPSTSAAIKEAFEKDLAVLAQEQKDADGKLLAEYGADLDKLAGRLREEKRYILAGAVLAEKTRVDAKAEIVEEKLSTAPFEVLTARAAYLEKKRGLKAEGEAKAAQRAARYLGALEESIAIGSEGNADAARTLFEAERARLVKAGAVKERVTKRTAAAGGGGGGPFEDIAPEGSLLSGLVLHTGDFAGHHVLVAVQPIFRNGKATKLGPRHGEARGDAITLDAKEGYAVGAINVNSGDRVDGIEIVFMKIKPGGLDLDPADSYKSAWIGGGDGGSGTITANGNAVVGIFGANGLELDSLGLIELVPAKSAKDPAKGAKP